MTAARERWSHHEQRRVARPDIDAFLDDVITVCKRHGLGLSKLVGLSVVTYDDFDIDWFCNAADDTGKDVAS